MNHRLRRLGRSSARGFLRGRPGSRKLAQAGADRTRPASSNSIISGSNFRGQPQRLGDRGKADIVIDARENAAGPALVVRVRDNVKTIVAHEGYSNSVQLVSLADERA